MRIICHKPFGYQSKELFTQTNILQINKLYTSKLLLRGHTVFHSSGNGGPPHSSSTRHSLLNLHIPLFTFSGGQKTIQYQTTFYWNNLLDRLKKIANKFDLKNK